jgi:3-hydroxyisobutyrate dehydrogenase
LLGFYGPIVGSKPRRCQSLLRIGIVGSIRRGVDRIGTGGLKCRRIVSHLTRPWRQAMAGNALRIGWIGMGRMGLPMAERLLKAGHDVSIWNRTASKAEPLARLGGKIVAKAADLAGVDVLFSIVSTGKDLEEVYFGPDGAASGKGGKVPPIVVDCSTIAVEESAAIRKRLTAAGVAYIAAPVSGNAKVIVAGRLSAVASGPEPAFRKVEPLITVFAPQGVSYVGEGELARVCKIAHNVMLGVVIENLIEITLLANKMGVPRHAFLAFMNNGVMGSMFTRYKSPALVNLDFTTTFTPELLRKDLDLGLELGREHDVPMPVTAAAREVLQSHFGAATLKADPEKYLAGDFAALIETMALAAGMKVESENKPVPTGLES